VLRGVEYERGRVSLREQLRRARLRWHGVRLGEPDWGDRSHSLALAAELREEEGLLAYLILNAYWEPLAFELPPPGGGGAGSWRRWIDTSQESPQDIVPWQEAPAVLGPAYEAGARSVVVLFAELAGERPLPHEPN
jgi:glycogen operon protein